MISFLYNGIDIPVGEYIFHHTESRKDVNQYLLKISRDEIEIIKCIEKYADLKIEDRKLSTTVINKDKKEKSMGLLWKLKNLFDKRPQEKLLISIPILYNIKSIYINNQFVFIEGECSR